MAITRTVTVAAGRFAAGQLGGLTPFLPFELVDAVLEETRAVQQRLRDLPSRVGMYFVVRCACSLRLATGWCGTS
ncbi:transposase domain-containing protein [Streptomyces europaeiscabiei]|nr:transposase domain-containing protein [Streptomyces europaeiscabiei]MDX3716101.1 transposase domain-containing protein [Streptomyces europaeiscabiei]